MSRKALLWTGGLLIAAGVLLLLRSTALVPLGLDTIVMAALAATGLTLAVRGFRDRAAGRVFFGTLLVLTAGFEFFRRIEPLGISAYFVPPAVLLALGLAFLAAFVSRPSRLPLLVGALVFCPLAAGVWLVELGSLERWEVVEAVQNYWPVPLVLLGISLLIPRRVA